MADTFRIYARSDTRELRKDLEAVQLGLGKELDLALAESVAPIAIRARELAPYDPNHRDDRKDKLPHLRDTIAPRIGPGTAQVVADVRGPVWEYGGHIEPRGVRIQIPRRQMAHRALDEKAAEVERALDTRLERLLTLHNLT
jgi:hypothetical protein